MKQPVKVIETIYRVYYACSIPNHRHKTESIASRCIAVEEKRGLNAGKQNRWTWEHLQELAKKRREGLIFKELGKEFGISATRARDVFNRFERIERRKAINEGRFLGF